jgi:hypothetical protein
MVNNILLPLLSLAPFALGIALPQASFVPKPGNFPAKADGDYAGGIFSIPLSDLPKYAGAGGTVSKVHVSTCKTDSDFVDQLLGFRISQR